MGYGLKTRKFAGIIAKYGRKTIKNGLREFKCANRVLCELNDA